MTSHKVDEQMKSRRPGAHGHSGHAGNHSVGAWEVQQGGNATTAPKTNAGWQGGKWKGGEGSTRPENGRALDEQKPGDPWGGDGDSSWLVPKTNTEETPPLRATSERQASAASAASPGSSDDHMFWLARGTQNQVYELVQSVGEIRNGVQNIEWMWHADGNSMIPGPLKGVHHELQQVIPQIAELSEQTRKMEKGFQGTSQSCAATAAQHHSEHTQLLQKVLGALTTLASKLDCLESKVDGITNEYWGAKAVAKRNALGAAQMQRRAQEQNRAAEKEEEEEEQKHAAEAEEASEQKACCQKRAAEVAAQQLKRAAEEQQIIEQKRAAQEAAVQKRAADEAEQQCVEREERQRAEDAENREKCASAAEEEAAVALEQQQKEYKKLVEMKESMQFQEALVEEGRCAFAAAQKRAAEARVESQSPMPSPTLQPLGQILFSVSQHCRCCQRRLGLPSNSTNMSPGLPFVPP